MTSYQLAKKDLRQRATRQIVHVSAWQLHEFKHGTVPPSEASSWPLAAAAFGTSSLADGHNYLSIVGGAPLLRLQLKRRN